MKAITLLALIFLYVNFCFAQTVKTSSPKAKKNKNVSGFTKRASDSVYYISGTVLIEDGHDEKVQVYFSSSVDQKGWDDYTKTNKYSDIDAFELITAMLALDAQYHLKNSSSFIPLKKQFFMLESGETTFRSVFKMMGRNGYGNLTETSVLSAYTPEIKKGENDKPGELKVPERMEGTIPSKY